MVYPHGDTLVMTLKVVVDRVARTLVDAGSSVDIIFKDTMDQLTHESIKVTLNKTPLVGFLLYQKG